MVRQVNDPIGVARQRRRIASDEVFVVANPDDQRTAESSGDDQVAVIAEQDHQPVGTAKF